MSGESGSQTFLDKPGFCIMLNEKSFQLSSAGDVGILDFLCPRPL